MRYFLFYFVLSSLFVFKCIEHFLTSGTSPNYLTINATNLDQHLISHDQSKKLNVFIIGSSGVAGSNVPFQTTAADYINKSQQDYFVYNLAKIESTCLEELIFLKHALTKKKPEVVLLGLSPDMLIGNLSSMTAAFNLDTLKDEISTDMFQLIQTETKKKFYLSLYRNYQNANLNPTDLSIMIQSILFHYKMNFFGDTYTKRIVGDKGTGFERVNAQKDPFLFLNAIIELCKKNNIKLITYLEPQLTIYKSKQLSEYDIFNNRLEGFLRNKNISFFNHRHLLPETAEYFIDYIHLKPKGYEVLAKQLWNDFQNIKGQR